MIPESFLPFTKEIPVLSEIINWKELKRWDLAAVYSCTHPKYGSLIVKWGGKEMAPEASIYRELVHPLKLPAPRLFDYGEKDNTCIMVMEYLGENNLEQLPLPQYFIDAAIVLAKIRKIATQNISLLSEQQINDYTLPAEHFLANLHDISLKLTSYEQSITINKLKDSLPSQLNHLYINYPLTIVHHDYMAKNLIITPDEHVIPIDWAITYLSPHSGDLYALIYEAKCYANIDKDIIINAYLSHNDCNFNTFNWELCIGRICWLLKTLRWLTYGGTDMIPGSEAWVPHLFNELNYLTEQLEQFAL